MGDALLRDRYELGPVLGGGEGSTTYLATQSETGERCVVKTLSVGGVVRDAGRAHSYDPDDFTKLVELFEREARVLAHLEHPGIPRFIDHFTESVDGDTRLYTVQEYVEGKTLQAVVEEGKHFTEAEARDVCHQLATILQYLHGRSPPLIHRDIKPTNVILDEDGTVHLVDFGSVRNAIGGDGLDGKTIVGTYGYMPIEQYEARAVPQSDFYALGMTLVFMLSHREPTQIPRRGVTLDFRPHVQVSEDFSAVLERLIEAAPEDRHASAEELLDHLAGRGTAVTVARPRAVPRLALAGLAIAMVLGMLVTLLVQDPSVSPVRGTPVNRVTVSVQGPTSGPGPLAPILPVDGVLTIDINRDFRYVPQGFPMGRSAGQTALPPLITVAPEGLRLPDDLYYGGDGVRAEVDFSYFPLGNGGDRRIDFALVRASGRTALVVDQNNDNDLGDEFPPHFNEGSGPLLAAELSVQADVLDGAGEAWIRPYNLWVWFDQTDDGDIRGRFYARNHYSGQLLVGDRLYDVTAFERINHDALYFDAGLCIDLDDNDECDEDAELFHDGDTVAFESGPVRLALNYP